MNKKFKLTVDNIDTLNGESADITIEIPENICRKFNICSGGFSLCDAIAEYLTGEFGMCEPIK